MVYNINNINRLSNEGVLIFYTMLKKLLLKKRDHKWHTQHTKKLAKQKLHRKTRLMYYALGTRLKAKHERGIIKKMDKQKITDDQRTKFQNLVHSIKFYFNFYTSKLTMFIRRLTKIENA